MSTYTVEREIDIEAPVEVVWRTVTEPEQIRKWWCDAAGVEARPGAVGSLTFRAESDDPRVVEITVVAADRPRRFSFRWLYPSDTDATEDNSTLVTFTLTADGDAWTRLRVVETGLDELDWPDDDKRAYVDSHRNGWQVHGDRLRALFAGGQSSS